ncbi:MAG: DUF4435 domain-containing protein [Rikenellaceae bacterium]
MRRKRESLRDHISDSYLEASRALSGSSPIMVYVEGYEDIAFWRDIFDEWEDKKLKRTFEITTPSRSDRAKGKKVVLSFSSRCGENLLLCVDSDFDYLFDGRTHQSMTIKENKYIIHTRVYAIENLQCLPESLSGIAAKSTKNDRDIFDFVEFSEGYSRAVYPLFLWYYFAAYTERTHILTLSELKNIAALRYMVAENNGRKTVEFIARQVRRKVSQLESRYSELCEDVENMDKDLKAKGVNPQEVYLWIQGHFWKDNVVKIALHTVCNTLKQIMLHNIEASALSPLHKRNELSSYTNSLRDIGTLLSDNTYYKHTPHYAYIRDEIGAIYVASKDEA